MKLFTRETTVGIFRGFSEESEIEGSREPIGRPAVVGHCDVEWLIENDPRPSESPAQFFCRLD